MNFKPLRLALAAGTAFAAIATAHAQEADTGSANDIVVTARRSEERLQDVPISITVFNQQQLQNRNVVNAGDLATYTPSLSSNGNFGSENTTFAIRGFAQDIGTQPSVGTYFAEVVTPRGASNGLPTGDGVLPGSFFDLQNIQVLKGPQGTLFGRNTTGGAVLLVPQRPTSELGGYIEGSYGNYDMKRIQGAINLPLSDTFRVRLSGDSMKRDGYLHNVSDIGPKGFNDVNYYSLRLSVVGELTPDLENYIVASYIHSNSNGPLSKLVAADPTQGLGGIFASGLARQAGNFYNVVNPLENSYSKIDQWQVINTTTWRASDTLTLKNIVSYSEYKQTLNAALFGVEAVIPFASINPAFASFGTSRFPFTQISPVPGQRTADQNTITEELQLQGRTTDDKLTYQIGGYYEVSNPLGLAGSQTPFLADCADGGANFQCNDPVGFLGNLRISGAVQQLAAALANPALPTAQRAALQAQLAALQAQQPLRVGAVNQTFGQTFFHNIGVYSQATYKFTDQLKLTGGIRYTWDRQRNVSTRRTYLLQYPPLIGPIPGTAIAPNPRCTDPSATVNNCQTILRQKSNKPTWLVDLDYTPNKDILVYAKYARGYRAATIAPNISAPLNLVGPEKVDSFEVGLKSAFGGPLRGIFNVSGFYNDFSNQQLQVGFNAKQGSGQASTAAPVNAGKSQIYGLEAEAAITPFTGLDLTASYTYLRTKIKSVPDFSSFNDPNFNLAAAFEVGDPEVLSPRHKLSVGGTYTLPLDASIGRISFGALYTYRSRMLVNYTDRENPNPSLAAFSTLPSLGLVNLNVNWTSVAGSPVDLSFFATNVTKERYYTFAAGLGSPEVGFETASVGEPRMYGVRARIRFGN